MRIGDLRPRWSNWTVGLALVLAITGIVAWALAGTDSGQDPPVSESDPLAGDAELGIDQPDEDGQPARDSDRPDGGGLEADSDGGSAESGEEPSSNRPPVIDAAGIISNGLTVTIDPEVSDPDGDDVTAAFNVNDMPVDLEQACFADDPCQVRLDVADVGYRSDVNVTIIATDSGGAETRETFTHTVSARAYVRVHHLRYFIDNPSACFREVESRELSVGLVLTGAIVADVDRIHTIYSSSAAGTLEDDHYSAQFVGEAPPPVELLLRVSLSGFNPTRTTTITYTSNEDGSLAIAPGTECEGVATYQVEFLVS